MIHVCYSNRTEELLAELVRRLEAERARRGPFEPLRVVVPNRNVESYVKLGLAQARGIAANLETHFLRTLIARVVERAAPGARAVQKAHLEGHLLALLHDGDFLGRAELGPVREYLEAAGRAGDAVDRRRAQLAAELARLFDEYASARPEMVAAWSAGRRALPAGSAASDLEEWQGALWQAIFGAGGLVARRSEREGRSWMLLGDLLAGVSASGALAAACAADAAALHVFGLSYMARGYHRMLSELGRHLEVRIYTLNPCREFWEDLETVGELRRRGRKDGRGQRGWASRAEARQPSLALGDAADPLGLLAEGENLPLRLWGRPGRESVRLLNQLTDGDFEGRFAAHPAGAPRTLLGRLQDDVLDRAARPADPPAAAPDDSITVLRCPGLRRELEVVAAEIWRLVRAEPGLRLNDVAVVVPEARKDAYLPHVAAVFGEAQGLPHHVMDLPLGGGHRLGEAVELLLALPLGAFSRRELLPLVTHPSIMARFPDADAGTWLRLADELGIVHGADRGDHQGTYIERDLFSWDQGLRRLALGALMAGPRAGDERPVTIGADDYLPADLPPDEEPAALSFALLVRSLITDARFATGAARPLGEWLDFLRAMLTSYLVPADEEEELLLGRCLRALEDLDELDLGDTAISYRVAAELARSRLAAIGGGRGQYLAHGVTVASLVPMRAIPFRVVFVVGLGHGLFPAPPRHAQLDLREVRRAPGDVSPREQDLYMFLETLLCTRDKLFLSYVARDELTGEALPPSSVLLELREILADGYLTPSALTTLFDDAPAPPLRRYDDLTRLDAAPLARREHRARALGRSLRETLPPNATIPAPVALVRALPESVAAALTTHLRLHVPGPLSPGPPHPVKERGQGEGAPRLTVPLLALRRFLEDPLQGSARFRLRMREIEGEEDLLERDEEAFETAPRGHTAVLRAAMTEALLADPLPPWEAVVATYERHALHEELSGRFPTGLFRAAGARRHLEILRGWYDALMAFAGGAPLGRRVVRFGPAAGAGAAPPTETRDPITVEVNGPGGALAVDLVGRTDLIVGGDGGDSSDASAGSLVLVCRGSDDVTRREKDGLRGYLDHLALAAAGLGGAHQALVAWSRGGEYKLHRTRFRPVGTMRARQELAALVADLLAGAPDAAGRPTGVHDYLLPCEAVFDARRAQRPVAGEVEKLRDNYFEKPWVVFSSVLGPVPEAAERHDPPAGARAEEMVAARFGLYFQLREEERP